jgi:hypothetical protein
MMERLNKRDTRILAASAAVGSPFIIGFRFQCDAKPLRARRIAGFIEPHSRYPDARVISLRNQPREEVEFAIGTARDSRIQNPFHFMRVTRLGLHDHAQALQLESAHQTLLTLSLDLPSSLLAKTSEDRLDDHVGVVRPFYRD